MFSLEKEKRKLTSVDLPDETQRMKVLINLKDK